MSQMLRVSVILIFGVFLQTIHNIQANFCSSKDDGDYPDPNNCYGYITCSNNLKQNRPCTAGLVWNNARKICDWKRNVPPPCGTLTAQTRISVPFTTPAPNSLSCSGRSNGNYPDPNNCRGYIACSNGHTHHMPCPAELKWNDAKKICDWPQNANPPCGNSSNSAPAYSCQVQVVPNNVCSGKSNGNYPDSSNCHGYIACANGLIYHMPCPSQLKWNDRRKICDWPQHAYPVCSGATAAPTIVPTTSSGGVGGNYCRGKANGNYPDSNNCYGYIACSNDITYHMPCPAGLKWDNSKKRCEWPQHANPGCSGAHQWPSYHCVCPKGNHGHSNFCSNKVNGNYADPNNCHGYIACSNGITYHMPCAPAHPGQRLVWNDVRKICDWKHNVSPPCGTLTSPLTNSPVTPSVPSCIDILSVGCCDVIKARNDCGGVIGLYCRKTCKKCY